MARFKNISGDELHLNRPEGPPIKPDQIVEVDGEVTEEIEDAYIVGSGEDARAWPKATWRVTSKTARDGTKTGETPTSDGATSPSA